MSRLDHGQHNGMLTKAEGLGPWTAAHGRALLAAPAFSPSILHSEVA